MLNVISVILDAWMRKHKHLHRKTNNSMTVNVRSYWDINAKYKMLNIKYKILDIK